MDALMLLITPVREAQTTVILIQMFYYHNIIVNTITTVELLAQRTIQHVLIVRCFFLVPKNVLCICFIVCLKLSNVSKSQLV